MKIAFLISNISSNTPFRTFPFAEILGKKHQVSIIGLNKEKPFVESTKKVKVIAIKRTHFAKNVLNLVNASKDAEIVCIVNPVMDNAIAGALLKLKGKKMLIDLSEDLSIYFHKNAFKEKFFSLRQSAVFLLRYLADSVMVGTTYLKKKYGGVILRTPVNLDDFKKTNSKKIKKKFNNKKLVVYGGSIVRFKGITGLVNAFQIVEKKVPNTKLLLVGCPKSPIFAMQLKQYSSKISKNIHFEGFVPLHKMWEYITAADCLVSANPNNRLRISQIPTKLFNYLATGKPIVATDVGDAKQILKNGECGYLVQPDNPQALAKGIITALTNQKEAIEKGKAAKIHAQNFSLDAMEKIVEKHFLVQEN